MALFESLEALTRTHTDKFALELAFTETYRQHIHDHPAIREAHCLRAQFKHLFDPIRPGDLFAGRTHYLPVGFGLEDAAGGRFTTATPPVSCPILSFFQKKSDSPSWK